MFHPLAPLLSFIVGTLSLLVLGYGGYFVWEYWEYLRSREVAEQMGLVLDHARMQRQLWWGIGMLAFTAFGRPVVLALLGRRGTDDPKPARSSEVKILERPDGTKLHVEFFGPADAPVILFTHGISNDSTTWYYLKKLASRYRLIVWDLRGIALSPAGKQDYALSTMAEDLRAVIDLVPAGRPLLLAGHSMGGMIMLTLLKSEGAELRKRISGLALLNTTYINPTNTCWLRSLARALQKPVLEPLLWLTKGFLWPLVWLQNWSSYSNGTSHIMTRIFTFAGNQTRGQLEFCTRMSVRCSPKVLAGQALGMFRYDAREALARIDLPTLVLTAPKDKATEPDASEFLRGALPHAQLVTIKGAAHASMDEQGASVREAVERFAEETFRASETTSPQQSAVLPARSEASAAGPI
ncbi:MAG TPA: alpha/beta hydrolase [Chthoniobacteraceae bacterium]|nr:alpha/beta hydrolase [Chthoniobacteraceae bacterium]